MGVGVLHLDWETRSAADLKAGGVYNYAEHPTTDILCAAWAIDDEPFVIWAPPEPCPKRIVDHIAAGGRIVAHNANFEIQLWRGVATPRYGWPAIDESMFICTLALCHSMALPGSLDKAAPAMGIEARKNNAGYRLMMQMCRPREIKPDGTIVWWDEPAKIAELKAYCLQDGVVERELYKRLVPLSESEHETWVLDQRINLRGVHVDLPSVRKAIAVTQLEADRLNNEMRTVTGNAVGFCTETARLGRWVRSRGVAVDGVAKADIGDALNDASIPADVRKALLIRQEAGKTSTAKLRAMLDAASSDGRLRGMLQYHGAATGRWAGRRVQLQNIPRWPDDFNEDDAVLAIDALHRLSPERILQYFRVFHGSPMTVVSYLLRPLLCAKPGHDLLAADFANIEGRGLAWLAGEEWKLDAYRAYDRGTGPDLYKVTAAKILGKAASDIAKEERQTYGKVPELACGYQGGPGAFKKMGGKVSDEKAAEIVKLWREEHPQITAYWYAVDDAFKAAIRSGRKTSAGAPGRQVFFKVFGSFLLCRLPSGRSLCYPYPRIDTAFTYELPDGRIKKLSGKVKRAMEVPADWALKREDADAAFYMHVDGLSNKWQETDTYGGKLVENITQAACRDILAASLKRCEALGYPPVLHVHDEVVSEMPRGAGEIEEFEQICGRIDPWAEGLPVVASGWRGERYRK